MHIRNTRSHTYTHTQISMWMDQVKNRAMIIGVLLCFPLGGADLSFDSFSKLMQGPDPFSMPIEKPPASSDVCHVYMHIINVITLPLRENANACKRQWTCQNNWMRRLPAPLENILKLYLCCSIEPYFPCRGRGGIKLTLFSSIPDCEISTRFHCIVERKSGHRCTHQRIKATWASLCYNINLSFALPLLSFWLLWFFALIHDCKTPTRKRKGQKEEILQ